MVVRKGGSREEGGEKRKEGEEEGRRNDKVRMAEQKGL